MKKISNNPVEVAKLFRAISKEFKKKGLKEADVEVFRERLTVAGFSCKTKEGQPMKGAGLRLSIQKSLTPIKDSGLIKGKWGSPEEYQVWKDERFIQITNKKVIKGVLDIIDELD